MLMNAQTMRTNADNCLALAEKATSRPERLRCMRMATAWQDLAEQQDWLDGLPHNPMQLNIAARHLTWSTPG